MADEKTATVKMQIVVGNLDPELKARACELAQEADDGFPIRADQASGSGRDAWRGYFSGRIQAAMEQAKDAGVLSERAVMRKHIDDRDAKIAELEASIKTENETLGEVKARLQKTQDALAEEMKKVRSLEERARAGSHFGRILTDGGEHIPVATIREACTIHLPAGYIAWIGRKDFVRPAFCTNSIPMQTVPDLDKSRAGLPDASRTSSMDNVAGVVFIEPVKVTCGMDLGIGKSGGPVFATGGVFPPSSKVNVRVVDPRDQVIRGAYPGRIGIIGDGHAESIRVHTDSIAESAPHAIYRDHDGRWYSTSIGWVEGPHRHLATWFTDKSMAEDIAAKLRRVKSEAGAADSKQESVVAAPVVSLQVKCGDDVVWHQVVPDGTGLHQLVPIRIDERRGILLSFSDVHARP